MQAAMTVLAHQGGWDEMLYVAVPIAVFAGLLWLANRRAEQQLSQRPSPDDQPPSPDAP